MSQKPGSIPQTEAARSSNCAKVSDGMLRRVTLILAKVAGDSGIGGGWNVTGRRARRTDPSHTGSGPRLEVPAGNGRRHLARAALAHSARRNSTVIVVAISTGLPFNSDGL